MRKYYIAILPVGHLDKFHYLNYNHLHVNRFWGIVKYLACALELRAKGGHTHKKDLNTSLPFQLLLTNCTSPNLDIMFIDKLLFIIPKHFVT